MALRKFLRKPKLEDGSLLSLFFYCDMSVNHHMQALNHLMRANPDNLDRRATLIKQLKDAQHNLMTVIMCIADQAIPDHRASRDFRAKYPDDVILEQINGPIWFGAECIAAGSHIANHEVESAELRPFTVHLSKVVTKLRQALRLHSITGRESYSQKIKDMLIAFDELWADFEFRYISLMCTVKSEVQYYHQQDVVVLFSESTLRAIRKKYLSYESIEMMDPSAMFAIPRLAILCGLTVYPDGPINPSGKAGKDMPQCFRAYRQLLQRIKDLLVHLNSEQLDILEQALCSAEGLGKLERNKLKAAAKRKSKGRQGKTESETSTVPDSSHRPGAVSSETTSSTVPEIPGRTFPLNTVSEETSSGQGPVRRQLFEPSPVRVSEQHHMVAQDDLQTTEVLITEPFPQFGANRPIDNDLPSSSSTSHSEQHHPSMSESKPEHQHFAPADARQSCTAAPPSPTPPPSNATSIPSASVRPKGIAPKGIAGFPSVEDLMHRLFLGISGVADQLQTNHAKDLRAILKSVFTVCLSEPDNSDDIIRAIAQGNKPEGQPQDFSAPLITRSNGFNFELDSVEQSPSWIPDADSPVCFMCSERFSWKRRRHHCRGCGHVVCAKCSPNSIPLFHFGVRKPVRVCSDCYISELGHILNMVTGVDSGRTSSLQV